MRPSWDDEAAFLADVGAAVAEAEHVPEEFLVAGRGAFAWRDIDADLALAELAFDSAHGQALGIRSGADGIRTLAFESSDVTVEIEVSGTGITGQVVPPATARVTYQTAAGDLAETTADAVGCFCLDQVPAGPARLLLHTGGQTVATSWVCLR